MDVSKHLFWSQGVFLQPQHFQLQDFATNQRFHTLQNFSLNHFRGVGRLEIDEPALVAENFTLRGGTFFFEDGTCVGIPETAPALTRSFAGKWPESEQPLDIYLALHRFNDRGPNVTEVDGPEEIHRATTRYVANRDPEEVPDLHADGPPAPIKRLSHTLKLFFASELEQAQDYHRIRIARLVRQGNAVTLSPSHIPPCLTIEASPVLSGLVQEIRDLVAVRCRVLEQYKSPNSLRRTGMDLRYLVYLLALATLNRYLPLLNHLRTARAIHPWTLYGLLCQCLGELSTFSATVNVAAEDGPSAFVPPYDHEDLWGCFYTAKKLCGELLEGIVLGPEYLIPLTRRDECFTAAPPEGVFKPETAYWLILRTETPEAVREPISQHVKLSAATHISTLIALAVPGARLEPSDTPPAGLPLDPKARYFTIDRNCPQWLEIEKTRTISLYWPEAPQDLQAEIAVMRK